MLGNTTYRRTGSTCNVLCLYVVFFFKNWSHVWSGRCTKTIHFVYVFLRREMLVQLHVVNFGKCHSLLRSWRSRAAYEVENFLISTVFTSLWKLNLTNGSYGIPVAGFTSEKDSTCILPFVHPNMHVITCYSLMWPEMHAFTEEFTWFLYVCTPLVIASHNLFPRGKKDALTTLLIHAN
jgi:hypothetical protein